MKIPWIQVYTNLVTHAKTGRLADMLNLKCGDTEPEAVAVGMLISLWSWATQNAYDGDLSKCSPRVIANACRYKRKPEKLVEALIACGWLDADMRLHDWEEYAELYMAQEDNRREKTRERVRNYRERKKEERIATAQAPRNDAPCGNADVTRYNGVTERYGNASTNTIPDQDHTITGTDTDSEYKNIFSSERKKETDPVLSEREDIPPIDGVPDEELPFVKSRRRLGYPVDHVIIQAARAAYLRDKERSSAV